MTSCVILSSGRTPGHRPEVQQHLLQTRNTLHCYMAGDPLDLTGVNPELREGWAFTTDPKQLPVPPHPGTFTYPPPPPSQGAQEIHYKPVSALPNTTPSPRRPGALLTLPLPQGSQGPTTSSCPRALMGPPPPPALGLSQATPRPPPPTHTTSSCPRAAHGPHHLLLPEDSHGPHHLLLH